MTDEDKKRIVSEPPPPTDEIDGEWGDDDQTLIRDVEDLKKSQPASTSTAPAAGSVPPKAASSSAPPKAASSSAPPKAAEASTPPEMKAAAPLPPVDDEEDEEEEDDGDEEDDEEVTENEDDAADEEEDDDDEDDDGHVAAPAPTAASGADWLPDWAPFAVLAALVGVSIVFGLGLVGGPAAPAEDEASPEPAASVKAPVKASPHP